VIKEIAIVSAAAFLSQFLLTALLPPADGGLPMPVQLGGLRPAGFFRGMLWQPVTALLLHGELMHLLGNLFFLWMFGSPVAEALGRRRFLWLYVGGGAAGGVLIALLALALRGLGLAWSVVPWDVPTIGASGAVFSVVAWYCAAWPDRSISLILLPLTFSARWMLPIEFATEWGFAWGTVNHAAHFLGALIGLLWYRSGAEAESGLFSAISARWRAFRQGRARRHLRVVGKDDGPMLH
jgi:membrane associated rhomboid family serine protease